MIIVHEMGTFKIIICIALIGATQWKSLEVTGYDGTEAVCVVGEHNFTSKLTSLSFRFNNN